MHPVRKASVFIAAAASFTFTLASLDAHATPRALPQGQLPDDARLGPLKDLDGYFPFNVPESIEAWNHRADWIRQRIKVSLGLWPMPEKTPLNPVVHDWIDQGDYRVAKVYFESAPGFFVTGNLYEPKELHGKVPGFLFAHGHWQNGRFVDFGEDGVRKEIAHGGERFEEGGRSIMQALCVQLARMGCVTFHYDMVGYADSQQLPQSLTHDFAKQRPSMNTVENWGLFSPQAEAHLQTVMELQTWNSIRSLDFLLSLPEVDSEKVGMTGASGGGTQTFILAGLDSRLKLAFPAVMVSTAMQGGCTCENASLLRIDTSNVEFAALFAPKPLGMTAANDWTKEMPEKGYPELHQLYGMYKAQDKVGLFPAVHFDHNYNSVSRTAFYNWVNRQFHLGFQEPIIEKDYHRLSREQLSVWDAQHPAPPSGDVFERKLLDSLWNDTQKQLSDSTAASDSFREAYGKGVEVVVGRRPEDVGDVAWRHIDKKDKGSWLQIAGLLQNKTHHEELPAVFCYPKQWNGRVVLWLGDEGKSVIYDANGDLRPEALKLVEAGSTVVGVDLLYQGEFLKDGSPVTENRKVAGPREFAGYTYGYNYSLAAQRIQDILTVLQYIQHPGNERKAEEVTAIALDGAGPLLLAARAVNPGGLGRVVVDTHGFRFGQLLDWRDVHFLPGGAKYGDIPGLAALGSPGKTLLASETAASMGLAIKEYRLAGAEPKLTFYSGDAQKLPAAAAEWLAKGE